MMNFKQTGILKKFFLSILIFLSPFNLKAQGLLIQPLACGVWGPENWTAYTEDDLKHELFPGPVYIQDYYLRPIQNNIIFLAKDNDVGYINNLQCVRWSLESEDTPYKITVSENGKRIILYEAESKGCGIMLFPDSLLQSRFSALQVVVEQQGKPTSYFYWISMTKAHRKKWLEALHSCGDIYQQVDLLLKNQRYREALSLLEVEKLTRSNDPLFDKLYWKTASFIRICPFMMNNYNYTSNYIYK